MNNDSQGKSKVDIEQLILDGRPIAQPPPERHASTLDEADAGLYRRQITSPRSTYDPFMAHFGEVSVAEGLASKHAGRRQRVWAWLMLVVPSAFLGCMGTMMVWDNAASGQVGVVKAVLGASLWWLPTAFWLYVMYRRPAAANPDRGGAPKP